MEEEDVIEIRGDHVLQIRRMIMHDVNLTEYLKQTQEGRGTDTGPLPKDCVRYMTGLRGGRPSSLYVIQKPPQILPVRMHYKRGGPGLDRNKSYNYKLSIGWTLWLFHFSEEIPSSVYAVGVKDDVCLLGTGAQIHTLCLPNVHEQGHGHFCTGEVGVDASLPRVVRINTLAQELIYNSTWNDDLEVRYEEDSGGAILNLEDWNAKTQNDKEFYKKLSLKRHKLKTLDGLCSAILGREENS
jgi:hypothetical protein